MKTLHKIGMNDLKFHSLSLELLKLITIGNTSHIF